MKIRNLIIAICLISILSMTLVCCKKNDSEGNPPASGEQNNDGTVDGGEIDLGGNGNQGGDPEGGDPEQGSDPEQGGNTESKYPELSDDIVNDPTSLTYQVYYYEMTTEQRGAFIDLCEEKGIDFFDWYNAAKAAYDEANKVPEIGEDGTIDIGGK